ncbi:hypothetical protein LSCM4_06552 [Leishmania orientalis]|uniref:NAD(+) diphosphatase n=1 Tax=Leishmania orientalis TaxID=2249476 RepID=A0A836H2C1_9TRYP|nr:hypothetical protein LSCM4_06552 [Leishmania orientalis]
MRSRSSLLPLPLGQAIMRRHERERRSEGFIARHVGPAAESCAVVCKEDGTKVLLNGDAASWLHPIPPRGAHLFLTVPLTQAVYVGEATAQPCNVFVVGEKEVHCEYARHRDWVSPMTVLPSLSPTDHSLLSLALSMKQWASTTLFCARCGGAMHSVDYGMTRDCTSCKHRIYPAVTPAIIVAVLDGKGNVIMSERRKTGATPSSEGSRACLTILAGFVAQGESMEEAVLREVMEEAGARVTSLRYVGSQPWPFPYQLMACYYAVADDSPHLVAEESELAQVRWMSREEVRKALIGEHAEFVTSPPGTATNLLLEEWVRGRVDDWGRPIRHV